VWQFLGQIIYFSKDTLYIVQYKKGFAINKHSPNGDKNENFQCLFVWNIDIEGAKIDWLSLFMCPLLAQLKIGFFSSFSDAAVYSTNEANKAGLKQSIIFRCLWFGSMG
jgi:hypothetical protein